MASSSGMNDFHEPSNYIHVMEKPIQSPASGMHVRVPVLFVSHGSPMMALEPGVTGGLWEAHGKTVMADHDLRGVVVMSPHWMTRGLAITGHPSPATWHDFGGFPEPLYALQYSAPGSPALASAVQSALAAHGMPATIDPDRPLDHGAWMPLRFLLPEAQVPVVQLSLPAGAGPREVYAMGASLQGLRDEGVWLIGSGSMTHNLREFFAGRPAQTAPAAPYVVAFAGWMADVLERGDREAAFDYRSQAPQAARAHPTDEHLLPLYFALGAAGWGAPFGAQPRHLSREVMYSHLAMDSLAFS
jgi:4,5-DOPA dioxygenase extradiol